MYEVVVVKADYEGWWLFEGWQDDIVERFPAKNQADLIKLYQKIVLEMKEKYTSYQEGKYHLIAFFNACELEYCEDCGDDMQLFYTPIMTKNNEFLNCIEN